MGIRHGGGDDALPGQGTRVRHHEVSLAKKVLIEEGWSKHSDVSLKAPAGKRFSLSLNNTDC